MMLSGVDVSNYQGLVDWTLVSASGRSFAFAKASESVDYLDPFFVRNWAGMRAAGLLRGAYHFARPSRNTPEAEAAHFLSVLRMARGLEPGDMLVLDLEDTDVGADADLTGWALAWLQAVEAETGVRPILYSGMWYLVPHISDLHALNAYPLWLAAYGDVRPLGAQLWQFTDSEAVPGVSGPCDGDRFDGTIEELRALGKPGPTAPDTWQTCIDVTKGWATRLGHILSAADQLQASRELLDVARMLEGLRPHS